MMKVLLARILRRTNSEPLPQPDGVSEITSVDGLCYPQASEFVAVVIACG